jgi:hypothetical protein
MADVFLTKAGELNGGIVVNRYILGDADSGRASQMSIQIFLNGGTATYAFQTKHRAQSTWQSAMAYPVSAPTTGATSGTTSEIWQIDASGKDIAVNVTAQATASPILSFVPLVG